MTARDIAPRDATASPTESPQSEEGEIRLASGEVDANPSGVGLRALLSEDLATHGGSLLSPGFLALAIHRLGNWRMGVRSKPLRAPLTALYKVAHRGAIALWGIDLPYNTKIGRRFRIGHHGAVFIGAREIGDDVTIRHAVTIGLKRKYERRVPRIGSRVEIGPGACIVGDIQISDDSFIGANTVLAQDVPSHAAALGVPGRIVDLGRYTEPTG